MRVVQPMLLFKHFGLLLGEQRSLGPPVAVVAATNTADCQGRSAMTDISKSLNLQTLNDNTSHEIRGLSVDELTAVSGGKTLPPSGGSEGGGFVRPRGPVDPRAI